MVAAGSEAQHRSSKAAITAVDPIDKQVLPPFFVTWLDERPTNPPHPFRLVIIYDSFPVFTISKRYSAATTERAVEE